MPSSSRSRSRSPRRRRSHSPRRRDRSRDRDRRRDRSRSRDRDRRRDRSRDRRRRSESPSPETVKQAAYKAAQAQAEFEARASVDPAEVKARVEREVALRVEREVKLRVAKEVRQRVDREVAAYLCGPDFKRTVEEMKQRERARALEEAQSLASEAAQEWVAGERTRRAEEEQLAEAERARAQEAQAQAQAARLREVEARQLEEARKEQEAKAAEARARAEQEAILLAGRQGKGLSFTMAAPKKKNAKRPPILEGGAGQAIAGGPDGEKPPSINPVSPILEASLASLAPASAASAAAAVAPPPELAAGPLGAGFSMEEELRSAVLLSLRAKKAKPDPKPPDHKATKAPGNPAALAVAASAASEPQTVDEIAAFLGAQANKFMPKASGEGGEEEDGGKEDGEEEEEEEAPKPEAKAAAAAASASPAAAAVSPKAQGAQGGGAPMASVLSEATSDGVVPAVDPKASLAELKERAKKMGLTSPAGNKGHKATWISAINTALRKALPAARPKSATPPPDPAPGPAQAARTQRPPAKLLAKALAGKAPTVGMAPLPGALFACPGCGVEFRSAETAQLHLGRSELCRAKAAKATSSFKPAGKAAAVEVIKPGLPRRASGAQLAANTAKAATVATASTRRAAAPASKTSTVSTADSSARASFLLLKPLAAYSQKLRVEVSDGEESDGWESDEASDSEDAAEAAAEEAAGPGRDDPDDATGRKRPLAPLASGPAASAAAGGVSGVPLASPVVRGPKRQRGIVRHDSGGSRSGAAARTLSFTRPGAGLPAAAATGAGAGGGARGGGSGRAGVTDDKLSAIASEIQRMKELIAKRESQQQGKAAAPAAAPAAEAAEHEKAAEAAAEAGSVLGPEDGAAAEAGAAGVAGLKRGAPSDGGSQGSELPPAKAARRVEPRAPKAASLPEGSQASGGAEREGGEAESDKQRLLGLAQKQAALRFTMEARLRWKAVETQAGKVNQSKIQLQHAEGVLEKMRQQVSDLGAAFSRLRSDHETLKGLVVGADLARLQALVKVVEARKLASAALQASAASQPPAPSQQAAPVLRPVAPSAAKRPAPRP